MALSKEEREVIRKKLPHGTQAEIANKVGCTRMAICLYLKGSVNNSLIEEALVDKFCQIMDKEKELRKKFHKHAGLTQE